MEMDPPWSAKKGGKKLEKVIILSFASLYQELKRTQGIHDIDLMEINIEGAEFALIKHIILSRIISNINAIQIQFHDFFPEANALRDELRILLKQTHDERWCFPFCWELWIKRDSLP
jgi:hypothetical protein